MIPSAALGLSGHRQRHSHAGAGNHCRSPRERIDVRRAAGFDSGAHIDMSTKSGTNSYHGSLYGHRGTELDQRRAVLLQEGPRHSGATIRIRSCIATLLGGTIGGPIIKDKLFGFVVYQHLHVSDQETGDAFLVVPCWPGRRPYCQRDWQTVNNNSFGNERYPVIRTSLPAEHRST